MYVVVIVVHNLILAKIMLCDEKGIVRLTTSE
jgi:hypothetical protein